MAIIYSYQKNPDILGTDILLGTSTEYKNGKPKSQTKTFTVQALKNFINANNIIDPQDLQSVVGEGNTIVLPSSTNKGIGITVPNLQNQDSNGIVIAINTQTGVYSAPDAFVAVINGQNPSGLPGFVGGFSTIATGASNYSFVSEHLTGTTSSVHYTATNGTGITSDFINFLAGGTNVFKVDYLGNATANSFIKTGGTSFQFLKADGSIDSNEYQPTTTENYKLLPQTFNFATIPASYDNATLVIRYDFNLGGASIVLPANVTLSFEGGSITNGSITLNNTTIAYENISSVLSNVVLTGTLTNDSLDVRLFGILPNNPSIDATIIINSKLISLDVELFFPKGNYYFTELHVTKNNFKIKGVTGTEIATRTTFNPFNLAQYYIIKLGGGKFTLNDTSTHIQYPIIQDIHFTTPLGYTASNLTSVTDITGITYRNAALVIDKVQVGKFAINGNTLHNTPLVTIGYSYEMNFDYINMYGNHGKSDLPIIQIANNLVSGQYISATIIDKIQVEVFVGSIFKTSNQAGINELIIGDVTIEGTIEWENESIFAETRFTRLTENLPAFYSTVQNLIPMFFIGGVANIIINSIFINGTDTKWKNSLDPVPTGWNTRSFFSVNTNSSDIKIGSISDGAFAQNMDLVGIASTAYRNTFNISSSSPEIAYYNNVQDNFDFISNTNNVDIIKLKPNYEYINDDFSFLLNAKFIPGVGLDNHFTTPDEPFYNKVINTRWDNYIISQSGFYVNEDNIELIGKTSFINNVINIEYYNINNVLLSTQNYSSVVTPNVIFKNVILLAKPIGYSYLKLVQANTGYFLKIYSIAATSGSLTLSVTPTTSTGSFDVLTRNSTTGVVEKKASNYFQTTLTNPITGSLTSGFIPVASGTNTLSNGILQDNGVNAAIITNGLPFLNIANTTDFLNVGINATTSILNSNRGFDFITNNSTAALKLRDTRVLMNATDNNVDTLQVGGRIEATQYKISALNTAPGASTGAGVLGEIRYTSDFIYVCIATNTWVRTSLATW